MRFSSITALIALATGTGVAGTILITDSPEGTLTVVASGTVAGQPTAISGLQCNPVTEVCTFAIVAPTSANSQSLDFSLVNMFDPDGVTVSELLSRTANTWTFQSDVEGTPLSPFNPILCPCRNINEDGTAQTVVTITYNDSNGAPLGTNVIQIQSDLEPVPEPSTWAMALAGLALGRFALAARLARSRRGD